VRQLLFIDRSYVLYKYNLVRQRGIHSRARERREDAAASDTPGAGTV
jgi:hypothetical protein